MNGDLDVVVNLDDWESVDTLFKVLMDYETFRMYEKFRQYFTGEVEDFFAYVKNTLGNKCDVYDVIKLFGDDEKLAQMSYYFNEMNLLDDYFIEQWV